LHTMYKYVLNSVVKISMMFAKYFEYYTIILRGGGVFRGQTIVLPLVLSFPSGNSHSSPSYFIPVISSFIPILIPHTNKY